MAKEVTLQTLAKKLNISPSLACRALNDKYGVSDEIREQVKKAAEEMHYRPRINTPPQQKKHIFLFLDIALSEIFSHNGIYNTTVSGISWRMNNDEIDVEPFFLQNYEPHELTAIIKERRPCGGISVGRMADAHIQAILDASLPVVLIDNYQHVDQAVDQIRANNFAVGYRTAKHLIQLGHRELAFIGNTDYSISFHDRYEGFLYYINQCNIKNIRFTCPKEDLPSTSHICSDKALLEFLKPANRPTGIMCANDACAFIVAQKAHQLGLKIPEDFSLVGCDAEFVFHREVHLDISTFILYPDSMGTLAAELLLKRIEHPDSPTQYVQLEPKFLPAESSAPPPKR